MAFCTSCGKPLDASARFCNSCGAAVGGGAPVSTGAAAAQPAPAGAPAAGTSIFKILLVVLAVVIVLGIVGSIVVATVGMHMIRNSRIQAGGSNATVSTPFGEIKSTSDPAEVAKDLGIAVYPGAQGVRGAGSVNMPGLHVAGAEFITDDAVDKVGDYYRRQFPNSKVDVAERDHQTLIVQASRGMITINVERQGDRTHIHIANLGGKPASPEPE